MQEQLPLLTIYDFKLLLILYHKINNLQSAIKYLFRIKVSIDIVLVVSDNVTILLKCYL